MENWEVWKQLSYSFLDSDFGLTYFFQFYFVEQEDGDDVKSLE